MCSSSNNHLMMIDPLLLAQLLHERLGGSISPEDSARLDAWLELSAANRQFAEEMEDEQLLGKLLIRERTDEEEGIETLLMKKAKSQLEFTQATVPLRSSGNLLIRKMVVGGSRSADTRSWSVLLAFSGAKHEKLVEKENIDITPGRSGAILTLADGSQMSLDSVRDGIVALEGGVTAKIVDGRLVYNKSTDQITYNTMSTPKGRIFQITLPDGSNVWLNSASSIRYPTAFKGNNRKVEIGAEAYLEIARDPKMPFYVVLENNAAVQVLGTSFNVNAYADEENIKATLIEGAIEVKSPQGAMKKAFTRRAGSIDWERYQGSQCKY